MNKKILFFCLGKETLASSRVRVYSYLPYLKAADFDYLLLSYTSSWYYRLYIRGKDNFFCKVINKIYGWISLLFLIYHARNFDVIFIQRVLISRHIFEIIRRLNPNIVFDFDDAVYLADRYSGLKGKEHRFLERFNYIVKYSKYVVTTQSESNQTVARSISKNVVTLTTPVDTRKCFPVQANARKEVVIGWMGSPAATHYLYGISKALRIISEIYLNVKIKIIGAENFKVNGINLIAKDWALDSEVEDLQDFDIGLVPLQDDEWSRNKYYKLLQYFAVGIPAVVSAVGICKDIVEDGVDGFLVKKDEDWIKRLSLLIEGQELRKKMGMSARKKAERYYSYEITSPVMIDLFKKMTVA